MAWRHPHVFKWPQGVPPCQARCRPTLAANPLLFGFRELCFALLDAAQQFLQHHAGFIEDFQCIGIGLPTQFVRVAQCRLVRFLGLLLGALNDGVLGDKLLGMLLCIGHDALGFAAGIVNDAVGVCSRVLNGAVGLRTGVAHQTLCLALSIAQHALCLRLRAGHDAVAVARDALRFFQIIRQGLFQLRGLYEKRLFINDDFAKNMSSSVVNQLFQFVNEAKNVDFKPSLSSAGTLSDKCKFNM
jgi:hypothetical protein